MNYKGLNDYEICGEVTKLILPRRKEPALVALIDTDDLPVLQAAGIRWYVCRDRRRNGSYVERDRCRKYEEPIKLHRFLLRPPPGIEVDHINHDGLDNRRCNLRLVTQRENQQNRITVPRTKKYPSPLGVRWHKTYGKWQVSMRINGKETYFGFYADKSEAERVAAAVRARHLPHSQEAMQLVR